jgi:hypothetical protein
MKQWPWLKSEGYVSRKTTRYHAPFGSLGYAEFGCCNCGCRKRWVKINSGETAGHWWFVETVRTMERKVIVQRHAKPGVLEGVDPCQQRVWICARKNAHKACWCWGGFERCKVGSITLVWACTCSENCSICVRSLRRAPKASKHQIPCIWMEYTRTRKPGARCRISKWLNIIGTN